MTQYPRDPWLIKMEAAHKQFEKHIGWLEMAFDTSLAVSANHNINVTRVAQMRKRRGTWFTVLKLVERNAPGFAKAVEADIVDWSMESLLLQFVNRVGMEYAPFIGATERILNRARTRVQSVRKAA